MFHTNNYNWFSSNSAICMKITAAVCFQNIILVNIFHLSLGERTIRTSLWGVLASAHIFGQVWQGAGGPRILLVACGSKSKPASSKTTPLEIQPSSS